MSAGDLCVCGHSADEHRVLGPDAVRVCVHFPWHRPLEVCDCAAFQPPCLGCGDPVEPDATLCADCAIELFYAADADLEGVLL